MTSPSLPPHQRATGKARKVEIAGQTTAGAVGSVFGAAKLRDSFKNDSQKNAMRFDRAVEHGAARATAHGANPVKVMRFARAVKGRSPGFKPLAVAVTAGTVATAAHRGQQLQHALNTRRKKVQATATGFAKAACCIGDMTGVPRSAYMKGIGKVNVMGYHGNGVFHVTDSTDTGRIVHRDKLSFHKGKKDPVAKSAFGIEKSVASALVGGAVNVGEAATKLGNAVPSITPVAAGAAGGAAATLAAVKTKKVLTPAPPTDDSMAVVKSAFGVKPLGKGRPKRAAAGAAAGGAATLGASTAGLQAVAAHTANRTSPFWRASSKGTKVKIHARTAPHMAARVVRTKQFAPVLAGGAALGAAAGAATRQRKEKS